MIKFKMIKPFIVELSIFVFVISGIFVGLLAGNFVEIVFHVHLITIAFIVIGFAFFISLFSRIINTGVRALFDFVFQRTKEDSYIFLKEQPYKASIFTEKFNHNLESSFGMYYLIQAKKNDKVYTFLSPSYVGLVEGKTYTIMTAYSSHIFLNSNPPH